MTSLRERLGEAFFELNNWEHKYPLKWEIQNAESREIVYKAADIFLKEIAPKHKIEIK